MAKLSSWISRRAISGLNTLINMEKRLNIRDDFRDLYFSILKQENNPIRRIYLSRSKRYYIKQVNFWAEKAQTYDPHKGIVKELDKIMKEGESLNDLLTLIDFSRTLLTYILPIFALFSILRGFNEFFSLLLLIFSTILIVINWYITLLKIDSNSIQTLNKNLIIPSRGTIPQRWQSR
jgi:hypothetical protein